MDFKKEGMSEWDGRQAFMQRLHNIIMQCHLSSFDNNYVAWYKSLMILKVELSSHIRKDLEREEVNKAFSRLKSYLYNSREDIIKFEGFIKAQESLHKIIRARGFDVPIQDHSPGESTR